MKRNLLGLLLVTFLLAAASLVAISLDMMVGYAGLIGVVMLLIAAMALRIMQDARAYPDVACILSEDAKSVNVVNRGTARAVKIHVALVPLNIEADVLPLDPDAVRVINLPQMVAEAKAVVTYESEEGVAFSQSYALRAFGKDSEDLLKPAFPLFGWK